jgi:predicted GTPase
MNEGFFGQLISALKPKKLSDQITFLGPVEDTIADQVIVTDPNDPINDQIRITDPEQQALEDQIVVKPASENEIPSNCW